MATNGDANSGQKSPKEVFDEVGCGVCGVHFSSSFRRCQKTSGRLCNSCHCKAYRQKRKLGQGFGRGWAGTPPQRRTRPASSASLPLPGSFRTHGSAYAGLSPRQEAEAGSIGLGRGAAAAAAAAHWAVSPFASVPQQAVGSGAAHHEGSDVEVQLHLSADLTRNSYASMALPADLDAAAAAAAAPPPLQRHPSLASPAPRAPSANPAVRALTDSSSGGGAGLQAAPLPQLVALQQRALAQGGGGAHDAALLLCCARRAQQATPGEPSERVALAVLPSVQLQLPDDPPGLVHAAAVLLEAVTPPAAPCGEGAGDSREAGLVGGALREPDGAQQGEGVALRLTVFASAGAVACWHEGPPAEDLQLEFCPFAKLPTWRSGGPGGFFLRFPHAFCPQVDLMAAAHRQVALAGQAALRALPTPPLLPPMPRPGSATALAPLAASPQQPQRGGSRLQAVADAQQQQQQQVQTQAQAHPRQGTGGEPFEGLQLPIGAMGMEPWNNLSLFDF